MIEYVLLAQMAMTTDNHSLGPGTYEEMVNQSSPPPGGYTKGWQMSKPSPVISSGGASGTPVLNPNQDVPDE